MRSIASVSPVGGFVNLYAPCDVPTATASASTPVRVDELRGLLRVGEHLLARERPARADAVLLARLAGLQRAEHAELALDAHADRVRHLDDQRA